MKYLGAADHASCELSIGVRGNFHIQAQLRWLQDGPYIQCNGSEHSAVLEHRDELVLRKRVHGLQDADVDDVPCFFTSQVSTESRKQQKTLEALFPKN